MKLTDLQAPSLMMNIVILAIVARDIIEWIPREDVSAMIAHCFPDAEEIVDHSLSGSEAADDNAESECYRVDGKAFDGMSVQGTVANQEQLRIRVDLQGGHVSRISDIEPMMDSMKIF